MKRATTMMALCFLLTAAGCGGGGGGAQNNNGGVFVDDARVVFSYAAATATDPGIAAAFDACVTAVSPTHVHPSWRSFSEVEMNPIGTSRWEITLDDVPVGVELAIGANDPNLCSVNALGAVSANFSANGVVLTRQGTTGGHGGSGFLFRVDEIGKVTP